MSKRAAKSEVNGGGIILLTMGGICFVIFSVFSPKLHDGIGEDRPALPQQIIIPLQIKTNYVS